MPKGAPAGVFDAKLSQHRPRLLVVDDEMSVLSIVERFAEELGFEVFRESTGSAALACLAQIKPDVVLVDLNLPEVGGLDVLRAIRSVPSDCQVILMTGDASVDSAMDAVKLGALDYLCKPIDFARLRALLVTVNAGIERRERLLQADADVAREFEFHGMIGRSPAMQELFDTIRRLAPHVRIVLVTGETGTGKDLVAKALHDLGPRRDRRLVTVSCSAVVETLFESELFGHTRGAFTGATEDRVGVFELASGGTLFLDEVGELTLTLQAKLLRAVENGDVQRVGSLDRRQVDVHVIAATNRDLRAEVAAGRFRRDLFYRLAVVELPLVPLRERREDIAALTAAFVRACAAGLQKTLTGVAPAAERSLHDAPWPGNVRELRNVIERACIASDGRILSQRDVIAALFGSPSSAGLSYVTPGPGGPSLLSTVEREQIDRVLRQVHGNKTAAARLLGVSRRSLYRRLDRLAATS